ncbi:MAG: iron ABC transporter permease [Deltaproteobacteria bacterium]|nr:iron ABC transporter permease [Deltaproteobacteria bacterium]
MKASKDLSTIDAWPGVDRPRRRSITQQQLALPFITVITVALVVAPLLILLRSSLLPAGFLPFDTLRLTLANFVAAYGEPATLRLFLNTVIYAGGSVGLGLIVACLLTWLVERTNMPGRTWVRVTMFAKMTVPPLAFAFGWIMLLNPNNGALNILLKNLFHLEHHPFDVYSLWMMIFVSATELVPTMFVMLSGLFRNMDPQLETAGAACGANYFQTLRRITLPLLTPGILSVAIYMLMIMVQAFEVPLALGLTAGVPVLSVYIYLLSSPEGGTPRYGLAAAFGISLLLLAILLMAAYYLATRAGERFRVVTGKGFRPRRIDLGRWRYPAIALTAGYFLLLLAPLVSLLWTSFLPFYQLPSLSALKSLSLENYQAIVSSSKIQQAITNTFILVFSTATVAMLLSGLISWFAVRGKGRLAQLLDTLAFSPLAIPRIVMAIAILLLYIRTPLYGTIWIIVLAQVTAYLAFGTRTINGALMQIHPELENAAIACGAPWATMMRKILLPLIWPHFLNGWLWIVAHSMRDLTLALTLMSPDNVVLSSTLWLLWTFGDVPRAAALLMLMVAGLLLLVLPVQLYASKGAETQV